MISSIPIYRAKKIDSDDYVEGFYVDTVEFFTKVLRNANGYITKDGNFHIVDISTLAIHFPNILDSQGNKIFASLQEDGKGGDMMKDDEYYGIAKYKDSRFVVEYENVEECLYEGNFEVIGIQKCTQEKMKSK